MGGGIPFANGDILTCFCFASTEENRWTPFSLGLSETCEFRLCCLACCIAGPWHSDAGRSLWSSHPSLMCCQSHSQITTAMASWNLFESELSDAMESSPYCLFSECILTPNWLQELSWGYQRLTQTDGIVSWQILPVFFFLLAFLWQVGCCDFWCWSSCHHVGNHQSPVPTVLKTILKQDLGGFTAWWALCLVVELTLVVRRKCSSVAMFGDHIATSLLPGCCWLPLSWRK